jgi:hypothetical protein
MPASQAEGRHVLCKNPTVKEGTAMKRNFRYQRAILASSLQIARDRMTGKGRTLTAARIVLRICPDFLSRIERPSLVVAVVQASHDPSCRDLIADLLGGSGTVVYANDGDGADSVVDLFLRGKKKKRDQKAALIINLDAAEGDKVLPYLKPDLVVVGGLSLADSAFNEDMQLVSLRKLTDRIDAKGKVLLLGDDVETVFMAPHSKRVLYSVARMEGEGSDHIPLSEDRKTCPVCGKKLAYEYTRFGRLGKAQCPSCGFETPQADYVGVPDLEARAIALKGVSYWLLRDDLYGAYTETAAIAAALELGVDSAQIRGILKDMDTLSEGKE